MPLGGGLIAGSVAAPILGGVIGNMAASGDRDKAEQLQQQALANIQAVQVPELQKYLLEQYQSAGILTPQMEQTIQQNPSQLNNISTDPRLMQAQLGALSKMQQVGQGGLQPQDMAALGQIQRQSDQGERAKEQSIIQDMQQRGQGASSQGAELAARLSSAQNSANQQAQQGMNVGALASQNALQAIMGSGQMGAQMQGQQFNQQAQIAAAQDAINRFNSMNSQQVSSQNTQLANAAQAQNLANKQSLMNQNTGLGNQQQQLNNQLAQQQYGMNLGKAQSVYGAQQNAAGQDMANAQRTANMWSGMGQGVGGALGSASSYGQLASALKNYGGNSNASGQQAQNFMDQNNSDSLKMSNSSGLMS